DHEATAALEWPGTHRDSQCHFIARMDHSSVRRYCGVAPQPGRNLPTRVFRSAMEARVHVGPPPALPVGCMDVSDCMGGPGMAGADWHLGVAGCLASRLGLLRAHDSPSSRPVTTIEFGPDRACTRCCHNGPWCCCIHCDCVSDFL